MPIGLNFRPQAPLVDEHRQITEPWFKAFLTGGALTALIDLVTEVTGILRVVNGGTGRASLTAHDVLVGNGASPVTLVNPSTSGYVLMSNGPTSDPSFQALPAGGDVVGPSSAVDSDIALFDGTTGKLIKDGGTISTLLDGLS